jgi:hypothetical protein
LRIVFVQDGVRILEHSAALLKAHGVTLDLLWNEYKAVEIDARDGRGDSAFSCAYSTSQRLM